MPLDEDVARLAKGKNLATVVTLMPSGQPQALLTCDEARKHIDELARKYTGQDYAAPIGPEGRVILKVVPDKVNTPRLLGR
jgi:hypothetical protein